MKNNSMTAAEKNAARLEKMRANLQRLEDTAEQILAKGESMTATDRMQLISLLNIAYHKSGKIETIASIDGSASCGFCGKLRACAENNPLLICGYCYAAADSWKEASWRRHKLNARILSSVLFTKEELQTVAIPSMRCRINEDGDVSNVTHARNILRLQLTHDYIKFGFWYKNVPAVSEALRLEGISCRADLPENVTFVQSSVLIGIPAKAAWFTDIVFTVWPTEELTTQAIENGSHKCNGRKCMDCGFYCYHAAARRTEKAQHVAECARCKSEQRARILAAYNEYKAGRRNA